jgi:hypothetical protein
MILFANGDTFLLRVLSIELNLSWRVIVKKPCCTSTHIMISPCIRDIRCFEIGPTIFLLRVTVFSDVEDKILGNANSSVRNEIRRE